jgi:hypothetical protein
MLLPARQTLFAGPVRTRLRGSGRRCAGAPVGHIAVMPRVSISYVSKVLLRRRLAGQTEARPQRCHMVPKLNELYPAIEARVASHPDATIAELRARLLVAHKVSASTGLMNKTLALLGLT